MKRLPAAITLTLLLTATLVSAVQVRPAETVADEPSLPHSQQQLKLSGLESFEPPEIEWNQTYGGADDECARSVVQTAEGGYALAGYTNSYGAGDWDFWLVKTDANGNVEWNRTYGGADDEHAWSLVQTVDGGYALAGYTYSFSPGIPASWLVKTGSEGNMQWNKTYEGSEARSVMQKSDGGYAIAGTALPENGACDTWLMKTDASGNVQWKKFYVSTNRDCVYSNIETSDGGYAIIGHTLLLPDSWPDRLADVLLIKTDFDGNLEWNTTYRFSHFSTGFSITQTRDAGYTIVGWTGVLDEGLDLLLFRTDSSGSLEWNVTYGESWSLGFGVVQTADGGFAIAGYTNSLGAETVDFWLIKIKRACIPGDINADGTVNVFDAVILSGAAGSKPGDSNWNPNADINSDNIVDLFDAVILSGHAGETET